MAKRKMGESLAPQGRTYKVIELVGTSRQSYEEAIRQAVRDAARTLKGLAWFEVIEQRGMIQDGEAVEFQAKIKIGFRVLNEKD